MTKKNWNKSYEISHPFYKFSVFIWQATGCFLLKFRLSIYSFCDQTPVVYQANFSKILKFSPVRFLNKRFRRAALIFARSAVFWHVAQHKHQNFFGEAIFSRNKVKIFMNTESFSCKSKVFNTRTKIKKNICWIKTYLNCRFVVAFCWRISSNEKKSPSQNMPR